MRRLKLRVGLIGLAIAAVLCMVGHGCAPGDFVLGDIPGPGDIPSGDPVGGDGNFTPTGLNGFVGSTEAWSVVADGFLAFGFGETIEGLVVLDDAGEVACVAADPLSGGLAYQQGTLALTTRFDSADTDRTCDVDFSVPATTCAPDDLTGAAPADCDLDNADGTVEHNGDAIRWNAVHFARIEECSGAPRSLGSYSTWAVTSFHPALLPWIDDPAAFGAAVVLGGEFNDVLAASVLVGVTGADQGIGCSDKTPVGSVQWDGNRLLVDLELQARDNPDSVSLAGDGCSIQFDGARTYCVRFDGEEFGGAGSGGLVVRVEGSGDYAAGGDSGSLHTLFIALSGTR